VGALAVYEEFLWQGLVEQTGTGEYVYDALANPREFEGAAARGLENWEASLSDREVPEDERAMISEGLFPEQSQRICEQMGNDTNPEQLSELVATLTPRKAFEFARQFALRHNFSPPAPLGQLLDRLRKLAERFDVR
jgi:hypothetical protein